MLWKTFRYDFGLKPINFMPVESKYLIYLTSSGVTFTFSPPTGKNVPI